MAHEEALSALGLTGGPRARVARYLELVARWNRRVNLTGAATAEERVEVLVAPVARSLPAIHGPTIIDVGSGNGSPGLVLALLRSELRVTLLEPRLRRWAFLRDAARLLGVDVDVRRQRHDGYDGAPADVVTLRAVSLPVDQLAPLVAPGGRMLLFGQRAEPPTGFRRAASPDPDLLVLSRECST